MPPLLAPSLTREIGTAGPTIYNGPGGMTGYLETYEETAELRWPNDIIVYDRMRRTDAQVASTLRAVNLPIRRTRWQIVGDQVDPRVRRAVEVELGLTPERDGRRRRRRVGITWDDFLSHALLMLPFGHMPFEQVYEPGPPDPDLADLPNIPPLMAHIHKLAPRLPRTITRFDVARDGMLEALHQWVIGEDGVGRDTAIPIDSLVMFENEREGADWTGSSVLRASYKHWLIKDTLLRIGPMVVERNGMGLPTVTYPAGGDRSLALEIATQARAGEQAGAALPDGYLLKFEGVTGTLKDEMPLIKYHDEAIGRNMLAMILDLGHDAGARALGTVFQDLFAASLNAITANIEETVTEHVIRDFVSLNFGEDEPYPELVADEISADSALSATDLDLLVTSGVVIPDRDLEAEIRRRYGLPALPDPDELGPGVVDIHDRTPQPARPPTATVDPNMPPPAPTPTESMPGMGQQAALAQIEARLAAAQARIARRRRAHQPAAA